MVETAEGYPLAIGRERRIARFFWNDQGIFVRGIREIDPRRSAALSLAENAYSTAEWKDASYTFSDCGVRVARQKRIASRATHHQLAAAVVVAQEREVPIVR